MDKRLQRNNGVVYNIPMLARLKRPPKRRRTFLLRIFSGASRIEDGGRWKGARMMLLLVCSCLFFPFSQCEFVDSVRNRTDRVFFYRLAHNIVARCFSHAQDFSP